jgi:hypothetical protein
MLPLLPLLLTVQSSGQNLTLQKQRQKASKGKNKKKTTLASASLVLLFGLHSNPNNKTRAEEAKDKFKVAYLFFR